MSQNAVIEPPVVTLLCVACMQPHQSRPEKASKLVGQEFVEGYHASDFTYIKDFYNGTYGVLCKEHDRDEISQRKDSDIAAEYTYNNKPSL